MTAPSLTLVLLWHHHQPLYRDPASGQWLLPWVRLHGTNEYYTMAQVAREVPELAITFNLVPVLFHQLDAYARGEATDPWLEICRKPVGDLLEQERHFLLESFFLANPDTMILPHPRYRELWELRGLEPSPRTTQTALSLFRPRDLLDLEVWFHLAWTSPLLREGDELVRGLVEKGEDFTEEEKAALLGRQQEILGQILGLYRALQDGGAVELATSPTYHPILPLLCDLRVAKEANPATELPREPFAYPEDAARQLDQALAWYQKIFGRPALGVWPPEGSVSESVLRILSEREVTWTATDDGVLKKSLKHLRRDHDRAHLAPHYVGGAGRLPALFFRDHGLSDRIGFVYSRWNHEDAVQDFLGSCYRLLDNPPSSNPILTIALDGENPWERYPAQGIPFLRSLYKALLTTPWLRCQTPSQVVTQGSSLPVLPRLAPGSWIDADFRVWIGHPEDNLAWEHLARTRCFLMSHQAGEAPDRVAEAWAALEAAEGSDWNWWYGNEHTSHSDETFDTLYRAHLAHVYRCLGAKPPPELAAPIRSTAREVGPVSPPVGFIQPTIDGRITTYFEWLPAGAYRPRQYAIHRRRQLLGLAFGFDPTEAFYLRIDLAPHPEPSVLRAEVVGASAVILEGAGTQWQIRTPEGTPLEGVLIAAAELVEAKIPLRLLKVKAGETIRVSATSFEEGREVERLPDQGQLVIEVPGEDLEAIMWEA